MIETAIAFAVIMLMISFLVKSLVSLVKNHFHYYATHLESEVRELIAELAAGTVAAGAVDRANLPQGNAWRALGEEYLTEENVKVLLKQVGIPPSAVADLKQRVELHRANLTYAFSRRMKNLAVVCGVGLCLALNINAFAIWNALYQDAELRARFADGETVQQVLDYYDQAIEETPVGDGGNPEVTPEQRKRELADEREKFQESVVRFQEEVDFGIGAIWDEKSFNELDGGSEIHFVLIQFLGSLLTGLFVSIGAPYLHQFLREVSRFRRGAAVAGSAG